MANGSRVSSGCGENVLELGSVDDHTTLEIILKITKLYALNKRLVWFVNASAELLLSKRV